MDGRREAGAGVGPEQQHHVPSAQLKHDVVTDYGRGSGRKTATDQTGRIYQAEPVPGRLA